MCSRPERKRRWRGLPCTPGRWTRLKYLQELQLEHERKLDALLCAKLNAAIDAVNRSPVIRVEWKAKVPS